MGLFDFKNDWRKPVATVVVAGTAILGAIKGYEGYSEVAYKDGGGVWTIGWGRTKDVKQGDVTTKAKEERFLIQDVTERQERLKRLIKVPVYQYEFDAHTTLAYNIGFGNYINSSALRLLNQKKYKESCDAFLLYNKVRIKGKLTYSQGLMNRRMDERKMCLGNK